MAAHHLSIRGGPHHASFQLELDGRPLSGVVAFSVDADVRDSRSGKATVTFHARLDIDTELETELVRAPGEPWWARLRRWLEWRWHVASMEAPCR